jgi:hypothetical protein
VAEHRFGTGHNIGFHNTSILDKATGYIDHMLREAVEIRLHPNNFSRDLGFTLNQSWYLVTNMIKKYTDAPSRSRTKQSKQLTAHWPPMVCV